MCIVFNLTIQVDDLYLFCNGIVIKKKMFGSIYEGFYHLLTMLFNEIKVK